MLIAWIIRLFERPKQQGGAGNAHRTGKAPEPHAVRGPCRCHAPDATDQSR
ncbi:hypothetical protein ABH931_006397 [Streptacidiphilus sp. MAP12-33]